MEISLSTALGALAVALSAVRAIEQLAAVTQRSEEAAWTPTKGALLGSASGAAVIAYAYTIGADGLLLTAAWISACASTASWVVPIAVRLTLARPCGTDATRSSGEPE